MGVSRLIGGTLGLISGFWGGRIDATIMALVDIMLAFPQLILAFAMVAMLGPGIGNISIASWLSTCPGLAILLTVLAINLVGDRIRDVRDPRVT